MRNYWINRIEEKERLAEAEKQAQQKKASSFVPPIYKKIGDPDHPRYGKKSQVTKSDNWVIWGRADSDIMYLSTRAYMDSLKVKEMFAQHDFLFSLDEVPARFIAQVEDGVHYLQLNPKYTKEYDDYSLHNNTVVSVDVSQLKRHSQECVWTGMGMLEMALSYVNSARDANELCEQCIEAFNADLDPNDPIITASI